MSSPSDRRGFLRGLAALPLIGGAGALIASPTKAAEPLTPETYIRDIRAIGGYEFILLKGRPSGPSRSPYWYYIDAADDVMSDGREAYADIEHRFRKIRTIEFHERVRDLLVADICDRQEARR